MVFELNILFIRYLTKKNVYTEKKIFKNKIRLNSLLYLFLFKYLILYYLTKTENAVL